MKKTRKKRIFLGCVFLAVSMFFTVVAGADTSKDIEEKKNLKEEYEKKRQNLQEKQKELEKLAQDIKAYITQIDAQIQEYTDKLNEINAQIDEKNAAIEENQKKLEQAKIDRQNQYDAMKLRIKYMYERGDQSYVEVLLTASDLSDMLNKSEYMSKITQYDRKMLDKLIETENFITQTAAQLEADLAALEDLKYEAEQNKAFAEMLRTDKQEQLRKNQQAQEQVSNEIYESQKHEEELTKEIEELERQQANQPDGPKYDGGQFLWPTRSTRITTYYGQGAYGSFRPGAFHSGIDIGAVRPGVAGDEIWAAYDGVVTVSAYNWSGGNWVWVSHGNGMYTIYMHMSQRVATVGQQVKKGDLLGYMGTTGDSSGVHLHFSVRINGQYTDPMPYFK